MESTQEDRRLGGLAHVAALFSWVGLAAIVVIYVLYKPKSPFVIAHTKQAMGLWFAFRLVGLALGLLLAPVIGLGMMGGGFGMPRVMLGAGMFGMGLISVGIFITMLVFVVTAAVKAFNGELYRYPLIGDFVDRLGQ